MTARIIGLDLALTTGFGVLDADGACLMHGHWKNHAPNEGRKAEDRSVRAQVRFLNFAQALSNMLDTYPSAEILAYEHVSPHGSTGGNQMQLFGGWRSLVLAEAQRRGILAVPVGNSTLRSVASPDGEPPAVKAIPKKQRKARREAWKAEIVRLARERWGLGDTTDDEADALWVAEACRLGRATA